MSGKNSDEQFEKSGDTPHDSINAEAVEIKDADKEKKGKVYESIDPLDATLNEKTYTAANVRIDQNQANQRIPEPTFNPPPITEPTYAQAQQPTEPVNPALKNLPQKDVHNAAEVAADMVIGGYVMVNELANSAIQIGDRKVRNLTRKGLLNPRIPIPLPHGEVPMSVFIEKIFNAQSADAFSVSEEFKAEVRPPLIREFEKRGIGATDAQLILFAFGKDIAFKLPKLMGLLNNRKDTLNQLIELTEAVNKGRAPQQSATPPPPPEQNYQPPPEPTFTPPPPAPPRQPQGEVIIPEVIPDEDQPIPEPVVSQSMTVYEEPKAKRKYTKKVPFEQPKANQPHRPKGARNQFRK